MYLFLTPLTHLILATSFLDSTRCLCGSLHLSCHGPGEEPIRDQYSGHVTGSQPISTVPAPPDQGSASGAWRLTTPLSRSNSEVRREHYRNLVTQFPLHCGHAKTCLTFAMPTSLPIPISKDLSTRSPLIRRSLTVVQPNKIQGPGEEDILGTQSWKSSFLGFLKAGLPGYTLDTEDDTQQQSEEEGIMLRGPPIWCPSESILPEPTTSTELESIQEQESSEFSIKPKSSPLKYSAAEPIVRETMKRDLDLSCLEDESEKGLDDLCREMTSASITATSRPDMADYLMTLRRATPDAVTLLTHNDRMTQLDLESRGLESTTTPLITPRLTTRESLFEDFEDWVWYVHFWSCFGARFGDIDTWCDPHICVGIALGGYVANEPIRGLDFEINLIGSHRKMTKTEADSEKLCGLY
eukprot:sb/3465184/